MRTLENTFSWSSSRAAAFRRCRRQYWWQYYGAWGGWDPAGPPEARQAYMLKNLSTRWAWVGTVVHKRIENILRRTYDRATCGNLRFEPEGIDVEHELDQATRLMRIHFRQSKGGEYRSQPKRRFGLSEHEYAEAVGDEEWRAMNQKARDALRAFLTSALFADILASNPATWFPIERIDKFDIEGTGVWAVPDFARRLPDGGADIFDWKTGAVAKQANRLQLACYTLYMEAMHGVDAERVRNHLVYLGTDVSVHSFTLTRPELDEARSAMMRSMDEMRALLSDVDGNIALREDFPMTDDLEKCRSCCYRRLCDR